MLGIVVIVYNLPADVFLLQLAAIKKYCADEYELIIVNSSSDPVMAGSIGYHADQHKDEIAQYMEVRSATTDPSQSHSFVANFVYHQVKDRYSYLFFLDHDCIPVKEFSVINTLTPLHGDYLLAGIAQQKSKTYPWPGCFMFFNSADVIVDDYIDFSCNREFQLDTGGNLYKFIQAAGKDHCLFFNEVYEQNIHFTNERYNYYAMIHKGTFMHFINGSNWANSADHARRLNSLINIVKEKTGLP